MAVMLGGCPVDLMGAVANASSAISLLSWFDLVVPFLDGYLYVGRPSGRCRLLKVARGKQ